MSQSAGSDTNVKVVGKSNPNLDRDPIPIPIPTDAAQPGPDIKLESKETNLNEIESLMAKLKERSNELNHISQTEKDKPSDKPSSNADMWKNLFIGASAGIRMRAAYQNYFTKKEIAKIDNGLIEIKGLDEKIKNHESGLQQLKDIDGLKTLNGAIVQNTAASTEAIATFKAANPNLIKAAVLDSKGIVTKAEETPKEALDRLRKISDEVPEVPEDIKLLEALVAEIDKNTAASTEAIATFKAANPGVINEPVIDDKDQETQAEEKPENALARLEALFEASAVAKLSEDDMKGELGKLSTKRDGSYDNLLKGTKKSYNTQMSESGKAGLDNQVEYQRTLTTSAIQAPSLVYDAVTKKFAGETGKNLGRLAGGITAAVMAPLAVAGFLVDSVIGATLGLFERGNLHNAKALYHNLTNEKQPDNTTKGPESTSGGPGSRP